LRRYVICPLSEFPEGCRRIVTVAGRSIGIFNVGGKFYALRNRCPHQGAPLCLGRLMVPRLPSKPYEFVLGDEPTVIKCPWHGWEFDLTTGRSVFNPHKLRVRKYEVRVGSLEADDVVLETYPVAVEDNFVILYA
jgi:nitrite reductase/ring-hydroxylating ferredoxin subunit